MFYCSSLHETFCLYERAGVMAEIIFNGEIYNDDRMFVLYLCKGTVYSDDIIVETTIYHENPPENSIWCLVTYRNTPRYTAARVDYFRSIEEAQSYIKKVEPTVPLISLGGKTPDIPLAYIKFLEWKAKSKLKEYDYEEMYSLGGSNPREIITFPK